jgi:hypothetical protein
MKLYRLSTVVGLTTLILLQTTVKLPADTGTDFDARATWYLEQTAANEPSFQAKQGAGVACARLFLADGDDPEMIAYFAELENENAGSHDVLFAALGQLRALFTYWDKFSPAQRAAMGDYLDDYSVWNAYGSETWQIRSWSNGYLAGQAWPTRQFTFTNDDGSEESVTGAEMQARMKAILLAEGKRQFQNGYSEFASVNYEVFHLVALANLHDFAEDPEVVALATALLDYHIANLALASFEGRVVAPYTRAYGPQGNLLESMQATNWVHWLYAGFGNPFTVDATGWFGVYLAMTDWRPPEAVNRILAGDVESPFASRQVAPFKDHTTLRYLMRKGFTTGQYAIGAGAMRHDPDKFTIDDAAFGIHYATGDEYASIEAFQPYFYSDEEPDQWGKMMGGEDYWRPVSPFMQKVHHENAVLVLFDVPQADPWRSRGSWWPGYHENFYQHRNGHYRNLIKLGQTRFPSSIDEVVTDGSWWFLREGDTFIAIGCLKDNAEVEEVGAFTVIKSREAQTGFVYEVGTADTFASFADFREAVQANPLVVDWEAVTASYTTTAGDVLEIAFNTSTEEPDASVPQTWINGVPEDYDDSWPVMESPWANLSDSLLTILMDGLDPVVWDWRAEVPVRLDKPPLRELPRIRLSHSQANDLRLQCPTETGHAYQLQVSADGATWEDHGDPFSGDGAWQEVPVELPHENQFFRFLVD